MNVNTMVYSVNGGSTKKVLKILSIAVPAVFIFAGCFMIGFTFIFQNVLSGKRDKCTEKVTAEVINLVAETHNYEDNTFNGSVSYGEAPVFEYTVEGKTYHTKSDLYSYPPKYAIGDETEILYDPDDPSVAVDPTDNTDKLLVTILRTVGGAVAAVGLLVMIILNVVLRKFKDQDELDEYGAYTE